VNSYPAHEDEGEEDGEPIDANPVMAVLSFLWFQRRFIIGLILMAVVGVIIYKVAMIPPKTFDDEEVVSLMLDPPSATIEFEKLELDNNAPDKTGGDEIPQIILMEDIILPESEEIVPFDPLIKTGSVDELIGNALKLRDLWVGQPSQVAFLICQRRAKIDRRLMELELTKEEQNFALGDYVESIICLDKIVIDNKMTTPQIRVALKEIGEKYHNHADPIVRAKSNLALLSIPLHDFYGDNETKHLEEFSRLVPSHVEKVFGDPVATARLTGLLVAAHRQRNWDGSVIPYGNDISRRMEAFHDPQISEAGVKFRERIFFAHLEPNSLVSRIEQEDVQAPDFVKSYFEALEANPESRLALYQKAVSVIQKYKEMDKREDYNALMLWFQRISTKVKTKSIRDEILKVMVELEKLEFGTQASGPVPQPSAPVSSQN